MAWALFRFRTKAGFEFIRALGLRGGLSFCFFVAPNADGAVDIVFLGAVVVASAFVNIGGSVATACL